MAHIRPFSAIRYGPKFGTDISRLVAPPYDVISERDRAALQARHPNNIVTIDLPHLPVKNPGPDSAYARANTIFRSWLSAKILIREPRPALYPYAQSFEHHGLALRRRGFFALVRLSPFESGEVIPHEATYPEAIEDRLRLMRATEASFSAVFGLYSDPRNEVASLLYQGLGRPMLTATLEEVRNDLWAVPDADVENQVIDLMRTKSVYIADGHHRYATALRYQAEVREKHGGSLPESHPANWCLFALVSLQDPGLLILPTHRLIGGLRGFDAEAFLRAIEPHFDHVDSTRRAERLEDFLRSVLPRLPAHSFALFDGRTRKIHQLRLKSADLLGHLEPDRSPAWRQLDVAIVQRYLIEEVIRPRFAAGGGLIQGYTADPAEIAPQVDGQRYQLAILLQPTPLHVLEELGRHGEVMPPKSTYFFPKLATGMVINPLS